MNTIPHPDAGVRVGDLVWFRAKAAGATGSAGAIWQSGRVHAIVRNGRAAEIVSELIGGMSHRWGAVAISKLQRERPGKKSPARRKIAPLQVSLLHNGKVVRDANITVTQIPHARRRGQAVPKKLPLRSSDYLAYVRLQRCARCRTADKPRRAHHMRGERGVGTKTDDFHCVALCDDCHTAEHSVPLPEVDCLRAELALREEQVATLIGWLRTKLVPGTR